MKTNQLPHSSIKIGVLGLGTVGLAVVKNILRHPGLKIEIKKACDVRPVKIPCPFTRNPYEIINDPEISVVVELIGGVNPAKKYILSAINAGKHVVTANKELIALHMEEILLAAAKKKVLVCFEGSVGGGIPIINTLRNELAGNRINEIYGIVNGTTNYILSKMTAERKNFSEVLKEAQKLGFAEANPKMDIEGYDASYKAAILASVAFGAKVEWSSVYREGIEKITSEDILYAGEIGYVIKLLAVAKLVDGLLDVRVHPTLVAKSHPLANVSENFNAIYIKGFPVGELMFYGPGAGGDPTSSAVINDIIAIARRPAFYFPVRLSTKVRIRKIEEIESRYYIRLQAPDRHGVLAGIAKAFADKKVSIAAVTQKETVGNIATIVILLHKVREKNLNAALTIIRRLPVVKRICNVIRII